MFRKVKSRTNLRQRLPSDDDDNGDTNDNLKPMDTSSSTSRGAPKVNISDEGSVATAVVTKEHNLLSFDDLEGDDITDFKLKRKDPSRRMEKLARKARLKQLQKIDEKSENESFVLVKEVKKETTTEETTSVVKEEIVFETETKATCVKTEIEQKPQGDAVTRNKFPSAFRGQIPDARAVYEARKKRERMRLTGFDGTIPLDDVQRLKDKSVARSRLVREDDNDISDEEPENGRFYSSKHALVDEEERKRNERFDFLAAEQGDDDANDQSDEEVSRWEREQMMKGVSSYRVELLEQERARIEAMTRAIRMATVIPPDNRIATPMEMDVDFTDSLTNAPQAGRVSGRAPTIKLTDVISKLQQRRSNGQECLNGRSAELQRVENEIRENKGIIEKLEMEEPVTKECFRMYQDIRSYMRDLLECLSEKLEDIKSLESRMASVLDGRAQRLRKRRRNDVHDMYDECSAAAAGKSIATARTPEVMQRAAEREARRSRRRRNRENTLEGVSHEEGLSTDDEETNTELVARQQEIDEINGAVSTVFADTLEEFCRISSVIARFVDWLALDENSFNNAYVLLCLPKLLSLFIRLELIDWNPLETEEKPLNSMRWYEDLLTCASSAANIDSENSVLVSLVPLCIEKVVLWKITDLIRERWDPLSYRQCEKLGCLLNQLLYECPTLIESSRPVQKLLQTISVRAQDAIDEDLFVPIYSEQAVTNPATGCKAFLDRQFWTAVKLMRCLNCLSGILSEERMKELLLDGIVNRSVLLAMKCSLVTDISTVRKCRAVFKAIPMHWWHDPDRTALQSFAKFLINVSEKHKNNREFVKEIRRVTEQIRH